MHVRTPIALILFAGDGRGGAMWHKVLNDMCLNCIFISLIQKLSGGVISDRTRSVPSVWCAMYAFCMKSKMPTSGGAIRALELVQKSKSAAKSQTIEKSKRSKSQKVESRKVALRAKSQKARKVEKSKSNHRVRNVEK